MDSIHGTACARSHSPPPKKSVNPITLNAIRRPTGSGNRHNWKTKLQSTAKYRPMALTASSKDTPSLAKNTDSASGAKAKKKSHLTQTSFQDLSRHQCDNGTTALQRSVRNSFPRFTR